MVEFATLTEVRTYTDDVVGQGIQPTTPPSPPPDKTKKPKFRNKNGGGSSGVRRNSSENGAVVGRKISRIENQFNKITSYFNNGEGTEEGSSAVEQVGATKEKRLSVDMAAPTTGTAHPKARKKSVIQMGREKIETMRTQKEKSVTPFSFLKESHMDNLIYTPKKNKLEFFKMTDKGLLITKVLELYPVKAEYVRAILDSHKIDEDGTIQAADLLNFFKTLYLDDTLRNDDNININKLRSEVEVFELQIKNNENKIKISDLALILPPKERLFLRFISFCRKQITSVEFFELLLKYASSKTGILTYDQLYQMVKDFAAEIGSHEEHCSDCVRYILALFNADEHAHLDIFDFPRLFNIEGNFLKKLKPHGRFSAVDFDNIIRHYDRDGNGTIDAGGELMALIADVLEYADIRVNGELLFEMVDAALDLCEKSKLQKLDREDLKIILTQLPKQRMS